MSGSSREWRSLKDLPGQQLLSESRVRWPASWFPGERALCEWRCSLALECSEPAFALAELGVEAALAVAALDVAEARV